MCPKCLWSAGLSILTIIVVGPFWGCQESNREDTVAACREPSWRQLSAKQAAAPETTEVPAVEEVQPKAEPEPAPETKSESKPEPAAEVTSAFGTAALPFRATIP